MSSDYALTKDVNGRYGYRSSNPAGEFEIVVIVDDPSEIADVGFLMKTFYGGVITDSTISDYYPQEGRFAMPCVPVYMVGYEGRYYAFEKKIRSGEASRRAYHPVDDVVIMFDMELVHKIKDTKWNKHETKIKGGSGRRGKNVFMQRVLTDATENQEVQKINTNYMWDYRTCNLEVTLTKKYRSYISQFVDTDMECRRLLYLDHKIEDVGIVKEHHVLRMNFRVGGYTELFSDDFKFVCMHRWCLDERGYISATINTRGEDRRSSRSIMMHQLILQPPKGMLCDHIDGNRWDNKRSNLRFVTSSENCRNRHTSVSGVLGVNINGNRWDAKVFYDGVLHRKLSYSFAEAVLFRLEMEIEFAGSAAPQPTDDLRYILQTQGKDALLAEVERRFPEQCNRIL